MLYKLDGGIDHLLLDEVQDTAPEQWRIAHRLTEEFFAGLGARAEDGAPNRSFFAVGDPKQSIYSFQGADPDEFAPLARPDGRPRVGEDWRDVTLDVSFRSTAPVLALVDAVFADAAGAERRRRRARRCSISRTGWAMPAGSSCGRWRRCRTPPEVAALDGAGRRTTRCARRRSAWRTASPPGSRPRSRAARAMSSQGRPLEAGDVLVLVRRRDEFATSLVRALKAKGVPVAGLDRLELTEQAAVQDLLAACDAVLLPEDDLAVACVLTSPLGGLTDESLMDLALGRARPAMERAAGPRTRSGRIGRRRGASCRRCCARADHVTPHALLAEALGPLGGRAAAAGAARAGGGGAVGRAAQRGARLYRAARAVAAGVRALAPPLRRRRSSGRPGAPAARSG